MRKKRKIYPQYMNEWTKENRDRINLLVPKGLKQKIKDHSKRQGYSSLNQYLNDIIQRDMEDKDE